MSGKRVQTITGQRGEQCLPGGKIFVALSARGERRLAAKNAKRAAQGKPPLPQRG